MFDFSSLSVASVVSAPALSVSQVQMNLKEMAVAAVFPNGVDGMVQTDTAKFAIPFDYEGSIRWVEVSFVAKKDDFDARKAEHEYQVKAQRIIERELAQQAKAEAKANQKA